MFHVKMIPNMGKFMDVVEQSSGDVFLHFSDDSFCNLKENLSMRQVGKIIRSVDTGFHLSLSDPHDFPAFLQYMMESATH